MCPTDYQTIVVSRQCTYLPSAGPRHDHPTTHKMASVFRHALKCRRRLSSDQLAMHTNITALSIIQYSMTSGILQLAFPARLFWVLSHAFQLIISTTYNITIVRLGHHSKDTVLSKRFPSLTACSFYCQCCALQLTIAIILHPTRRVCHGHYQHRGHYGFSYSSGGCYDEDCAALFNGLTSA